MSDIPKRFQMPPPCPENTRDTFFAGYFTALQETRAADLLTALEAIVAIHEGLPHPSIGPTRSAFPEDDMRNLAEETLRGLRP